MIKNPIKFTETEIHIIMPKARKSKNKSGGRETMNATSEIVTHYSKGDQVFAKMAGYPPWPGKV